MSDVSDLSNDNAVYRTLLESTRAIPWKIDWATKKFAYIGPQIEALLGWSPDSWMTVDDWVARMHPDDRDAALEAYRQSLGRPGRHEVRYRVPHADGAFNRCYSLSSAPGIDSLPKVTVKRVGGGKGSNWFHDALKEGGTLDVLPEIAAVVDSISRMPGPPRGPS
mgnify:CR=1 FL=1